MKRIDKNQGLRRILRPEVLIWVLLLLLLAERLWIFRELGVSYMSHSDDDAYVASGLFFAQTGVISISPPHPSAMIMPAMPVVIGLFSLVFGQGTGLLLALKLCWIGMGVLTAYVCFRTAALLTNGWGGLAAAAWFLVPNMAWMNHLILTETPYMLFFTLCLYFTMQMGRSGRKRYFVGYVLSFMAALLFRANILPMPLFTALWMLHRRQSGRLLLRRALVLGCALLLFVIPWGLRNQRQFGAFIPISYGAGDPLLLGTYEGEGYPADEELDYDEHVHQPMRQRYAAYYRQTPQPYDEDDVYIRQYDPEGEILNLDQAEYVSMQERGLKARYRLREWWKRDPGSLLKTYLYIKPRWMLNWSWAWEEVLGVPYAVLHRISQVNLLLCGGSVLLALLRKRCRGEALFFAGVYAVSVYIYATAFVSDRYASTLHVLRYILVGLGVGLMIEWIATKTKA